jgi:hypothetical protein
MVADNQQERLNNYWISGFVDGEGCFFIGINKNFKMKTSFQILPEFRLVQHQRDINLLHAIKNYLNIGVVRRNHGERYELRVRKLSELKKLINFFNKYPLKSKKQLDFIDFSEVVNMLLNKEHFSENGINKIKEISNKMNRKRLIIQNPQRLHAENKTIVLLRYSPNLAAM